MPAYDRLSEHDRAVLKSIFDPTSVLGDSTAVDDSDLLLDQDEETLAENEEMQRVKEIEVEAVRCAEAGQHEQALLLLEQVVTLSSKRAASYNNRAQLLRLLGREEEALADLNKAIELSEGTKSKARAQALCQRGLIMKKRQLKDLARSDFQQAAKLGSAFAKKQVVEMNPYAALCNQMLRQVMTSDAKILNESDAVFF